MEDIKTMMKQISADIAQQNLKMTKSITEQVNNNINEKFDFLQIINTELKEKIEEQEFRINILEKKLRQRNLLIFGVDETENNYKELQKAVIKIINEKLKLDCSYQEFSSIRRLGRKNEKIRPVMISLHSMETKIEILKKKKLLENSNYYITEDFPPKILARRKELREEVEKLRQQGKKAIIKYDKIVVIDKKPKLISGSDKTNKHKRKLSETPERKTTSDFGKNPTKKITTYNLTSFVTREHRTSNSSL